MEIFEPWHNASLLSFIKINGKVSIKQIKEEFSIDDGVVNLHNLIDKDIQILIDLGKIKFVDGYYIAT